MQLWKKILLTALTCSGVYFFCEWQTQGFRFYQLLSDLPNNKEWEIPITDAQIERVNSLLEQPFTYLGKGGFCTAFLGADDKTVLKFYHHQHLRLLSTLNPFSWSALLLKPALQTSAISDFHLFAFKSGALLYQRVKERTGLFYVHLNKTNMLKNAVTLIDPSGVAHTIDLNQTEFVLQQKAELLLDALNRTMRNGQEEQAKKMIDSYFNCLVEISKQSLRDLDRSFRYNFGVLEDGTVITIDISSFVHDERLLQPSFYKRELVLKSHPLSKWLKKHHPTIYTYYDEKITQLMD
jgi:hypothetical protein